MDGRCFDRFLRSLRSVEMTVRQVGRNESVLRKDMETLRLLCDYFPTAVFTGTCLVFISEDWRVELTEHKDKDFSKSGAEPSIIRVRISKKALDGDFITGHYEDFQLESPGELAEQIEKYVQSAIGRNIREI